MKNVYLLVVTLFLFNFSAVTSEAASITTEVISVSHDIYGEDNNWAVVNFEIKITAVDGDVYLPWLSSDNPDLIHTGAGFLYSVSGFGSASTLSILSESGGSIEAGYWEIQEGVTERASVQIGIYPAVTGLFRTTLEEVRFTEGFGETLVIHEVDARSNYMALQSSVPEPTTALMLITSLVAIPIRRKR